MLNVTRPLRNFTFAEQEELVISDLLNVLIGIEGVYIRFVSPESQAKNHSLQFTSFELDSTLDNSLSDIVTRILPTAAQYMSLCMFLDEHGKFEYGKVNHALTAAVRNLLKDYLLLISQLDSVKEELTIQKLWYYCNSVSSTMSQLAHLAQDLSRVDSDTRKPSWSHRNSSDERLKALMAQVQSSNTSAPTETVLKNGGAVLKLLWDRLMTQSGNPATYKLFAHLLSKASVPYFEMLKTLLTIGVVDDPYHEFMVVERRLGAPYPGKTDFDAPKDWYSAEQLWDARWSLRSNADSIPPFLEPFKDKILATSKYLNLVKECSVRVDFLREAHRASANAAATVNVFEFDASGSRIEFRPEWQQVIDSAYKSANGRLLAVLCKEHSLMQQLASLKRFFLLSGALVFAEFFESGVDELLRAVPTDGAPLQSLLDLSIRNRASLVPHDDLLKDKIQLTWARDKIGDVLLRICDISGSPTTVKHAPSQTAGGMKAWEALSLSVSAEFPVSLVVNRKSLQKYQFIFRHVFKLQFLDYRLSICWKELRRSTRDRELVGLRSVLPRRPSFNGTSRSLNPAAPLEVHEQELLVERTAVFYRLYTFLRQMLYYQFGNVIEPNWKKFEADFAAIETVDNLLEKHTDLLDTCLKESMLTSPKLLKEQLALFDLIEQFLDIEDQIKNKTLTLASCEGLKQDLKGILASFSSHVSSLINALSYYATIDGSKLSSLGFILDSFGGFK